LFDLEFCSLIALAPAQSNNNGDYFTGVVQGSSGAAVVGAAVGLLTASQIRRQYYFRPTGQFQIKLCPPGTPQRDKTLPARSDPFAARDRPNHLVMRR